MATVALSDAQLVARCRAQDQAAWNELVTRFSRYVFAIAVQAYRLGHDDAEDVFQEVFSRVYKQLDSLHNDSALRPWIGQLTRRLCIDRLRAGGRVRVTADDAELEPADAVDRLEELEQALVVHEALATLPEQCREVLDRFFARDESYRTIGEALSLPQGTIASRIARCLEKLRAALGEEDVHAHRLEVRMAPTFEHDEETLGRLLAALPPAPAAWVRAAQELPVARRALDEIVQRAEADAAFRRALVGDLERALADAGYEPERPLLEAVRRHLRTG